MCSEREKVFFSINCALFKYYKTSQIHFSSSCNFILTIIYFYFIYLTRENTVFKIHEELKNGQTVERYGKYSHKSVQLIANPKYIFIILVDLFFIT